LKKTKAVSIVFAWVFLVCVVSVFLGCEGEQGPAGPAGPPGADGADGTALCGTCHSISTKIVAVQGQYQASTHAMGATSERGESADCALCHTSEGFRQHVAGEEVTGAVNPTQPNCRTCHNIHTNYDETDYDLAVTGSVDLISAMMDASTTVDFGKGSVCVTCHQSQPYGYTLEVGGGDFEVTSSRFGAHHGPQGNIVAGFGAYEVSGSVSYPTSSAHTTMIADGCVTCHMATPYGFQAGGHTMKMGYESHGALEPNIAGCVSCHADIESFDINGAQTEIEELLSSLLALLVKEGATTESGSMVTGTYPSDVAGAMMNYAMCLEDKSNGVHNPKYVKALLTNSIESLQ